jgi:hypothetical protein
MSRSTESWARANVGGGQTFAGGAEFSVYGTQEERVPQVAVTVGSGA